MEPIMNLSAALVSVSLVSSVFLSSCGVFIAGESLGCGVQRYALSANSVTAPADVTVTYQPSLCDASPEFTAAKKTLVMSLDGRRAADVVLGNELVNESFSGVWHIDAPQINSFKGRKQYSVSVRIETLPTSKYLQPTVEAKDLKDNSMVIDSQ